MSTSQLEPAYSSLDDFFSDSALRHSNRPALFAGGRYWSYSALDERCRVIEQLLIAGEPADRGRTVGLVYGRSWFSYAAVIAIMRARNVYVPLNPKMPEERLLRILEDAGIGTVLLDASEGLSEGVVGMLRRAKSLRILVPEGDSTAALEGMLTDCSHRLWKVSEKLHAQPPPVLPKTAQQVSELAYMIYTSGSTGIPKGVPITHASARSCVTKCQQMLGTDDRDRFTGFSALSFDVSIADIFLCWKSGGTLYVPAAVEALVPLAFVAKHEITVWSSVPSLANFLLKLRLLKSETLSHVRLFLFAGEALPVELARACLGAAPRARVFNLYGPTECTIFSTFHEYSEQSDSYGGTVPIGLPLPGLQHRIVVEGRVVEAEDEPGELWLSGDQLACGYWNNPTATEAAFVDAPAGELRTAVWYRTGDLVSYHRPVGLVFRGRLDRQVKLRGYRVELQEVESALRRVIGCAQVAVVPVRNSGGICEKLIAYCDELSADEATIKELCSRQLATYMVPDRILRLETFPLSANGKVDYLALTAQAKHSEQQDTGR